MEPHVVLINGPAGIGKSTAARKLADLAAGTVCIQGDAVRSLAPADARTVLGPGSTYRAAAALAATYLAMGASRVIVEYVFETRAHVDHFRRTLAGDVPIHLITLWATLDTVRAREADRASRVHLGSRLDACYANIQSSLTLLGRVLPTDALSPSEIAAHLDDIIRRGEGRMSSLVAPAI